MSSASGSTLKHKNNPLLTLPISLGGGCQMFIWFCRKSSVTWIWHLLAHLWLTIYWFIRSTCNNFLLLLFSFGGPIFPLKANQCYQHLAKLDLTWMVTQHVAVMRGCEEDHFNFPCIILFTHSFVPQDSWAYCYPVGFFFLSIWGTGLETRTFLT